jgi:hypothetical protein
LYTDDTDDTDDTEKPLKIRSFSVFSVKSVYQKGLITAIPNEPKNRTRLMKGDADRIDVIGN